MNRTFFKIAGVACVVILVGIFIVQKHLGSFSPGGRCGNSYQGYDTYHPPSYNSVQRVYLSLDVDRFSSMQTYLNLIVSKYAGRLISLTTYQPSNFVLSGNFIFEVPVESLPATLNDIRAFGKLRAETNTGLMMRRFHDNSRYSALAEAKAKRDELLQMYAQAGDLYESQRIQQQLAGMVQQIQLLETNTSVYQYHPQMATVTVNYNQNIFSMSKFFEGCISKLSQIARSTAMFLVNMVNGLIAFLTFLLPIFVWITIISLVIFGGIKLFRSRSQIFY